MNSSSFGSVVAMEFKAKPSISFSDIVEDFDNAFQMVDTRTRSLTWDCDDIAIIDRDYVRVAIGWLPSKGKGQPWHLVFVVGCAPNEDIAKVDVSSYEFLADRILDRTNEFLPSTAVLRGEARTAVGPELVDTLFDLLRADTNDMAPDSDLPADVIRPQDEGADDYADMVETMLPPWAMQATQNVDGRSQTSPNYAAVLFDKAEAKMVRREKLTLGATECSQPMRLTIHTLALSLYLYAPPLGAAMFAYTMMRDIFPAAAQSAI